MILENEQNIQKPNYFYYAVPKGLINVEEIPEECGLLYIQKGYVSIIKSAPLLHKEKANIESLNLIDKFYYGMWNYIDKYRKDNIASLKKEITQLKKQILEYDQLLSEANCKIDELNEKIVEQQNIIRK